MVKTQVMKEFEAISAVPRCSFHNEKILKYITERAENLGLEYVFDDKNGNILIRKPASKGKRDRMAVVLQGHLDMVPQVKPGLKHDFTKEPLDLKIKDDHYYAEGTTLGADDGIAAAMALAVLEDDSIKNPPLEVLLTTDEEVGMLSVKDADLSYVHGKYLINIDHCEEGQFITGCCGGTKAHFHIPLRKEKFTGIKYTISIDGLKGGHSGLEIDKERANSIKLMAQLLYELAKTTDYRLADFDAPGKDNAISRGCTAVIVAKKSDEEQIKKTAREMRKKFRAVFRNTDPLINIAVKTGSRNSKEVLTDKCGKKLVSLIMQLPYGVIKREQHDFSKPETSANIGVVSTGEKTIELVLSIRSSVEQRAEMIANRCEDLAKILGVKTEITKEYPAWLPDMESPLIPVFKRVYKKLYGQEPEVTTVHAGLECGYILEKSGIKSAISMGAAVVGEHTTEEKLSISSLNRMYDFLVAVLETV